jgi:hypothetical protein
MKPPSPITGSITAHASDAGFTLLARKRAKSAMPRATNVLLRHAARAAQRVGDGKAVDLGSERAEAVAVRRGLGGEREREQRAPVEAGIERQHRGPPGGAARDLDRVLDRLGAAVEERGARLARDRRDPAQRARQRHVGLVRRHHEARVLEPVELLAHPGEHAPRAVALRSCSRCRPRSR